ncbi:hypothetical protein ABW19_dt0202172 [Dactylella cylindrospora]|nr:hypothetical protein ABW19_dt0202172 [Dactylella cylindrospora]
MAPIPATSPDSADQSIPRSAFSLLDSFNDPSLSDITITGGSSKQILHVHRIVISSSSRYFKALCHGSFRESASKIINLPEIPFSVLEIILRWQYGERYALPSLRPPKHAPSTDDPQNDELILATFKAADYLQIPLLQRDIIFAISDEFRFRPRVRFPDPMEFMSELCNETAIDANAPKYPPAGDHSNTPSEGFAAAEKRPVAKYTPMTVLSPRRSSDPDLKLHFEDCMYRMFISYSYNSLEPQVEALKKRKDLADHCGFQAVVLPIWENHAYHMRHQQVYLPVEKYENFHP